MIMEMEYREYILLLDSGKNMVYVLHLAELIRISG